MSRRDILTAVASGVLLILIFPGFYLNELAWACLVPMLYASHGKEPLKGFLAGCITGTVFHCGLIYWVTFSMTTYGGLPVCLSVLLLIFFSIFLSIFFAIPVYLSCYVQKVYGLGLCPEPSVFLDSR